MRDRIDFKYAYLTALMCALSVLVAPIIGHAPEPTFAQGGAECSTLVTEALQVVGTSCAATGRNEACYGHTLVVATFREGVTDIEFEDGGDIAPLVDLRALVTRPADPETGMWGVALMKVQADLPDEGGQAMTFVLFGDTELTDGREPGHTSGVTCLLTNQGGNNINVRSGPGTGYAIVEVLTVGDTASTDGRNVAGDWVRVRRADTLGWVYAPLVQMDCEAETLAVVEGQAAESASARPMQAFTLRTDEAGPCDEAPNGLLIQSPTGQRARVMVNGVQLEFASTGFLTAMPDDVLSVSGLEGAIFVTAFDQTVAVTPGFEVRVPLADGVASGPPTEPQTFEWGAVINVWNELTGETELEEIEETGESADQVEVPVSSASFTVVVPGDVLDWMDSGITVTAGQTISLWATGIVDMWDNCETEKYERGADDLICLSIIVGPEGGEPMGTEHPSSYFVHRPDLPAPDLVHGALIARIGTDVPFMVGTNTTIVAAEDGTLQFRGNDGQPWDNTGQFVVAVVVSD